MQRRQLLTAALTTAALSLAAIPQTMAQEKYPVKPIRLVIPFPPGGIMDTIGRQWADRVSPLLGNIIVDNRSGAGGTVGAGEVARSKPDGYTLLMGNTSTQILNPTAMSKPPYDPQKDFVAIDILAQSATSLVVHPSLPIRNVNALIAYAKANPGKLSYGSAGAGTMTHLSAEMFKQRAGGIDILHVPYKGTGLASADLLGGYIPMMTPHINSQLLSWHRDGRIRILAINAPKRLQAAPNIPVTSEFIPDMVAQLFSGIFAPAGTPPAIVERISQASRKAMMDPGFQKALLESGSEPVLEGGPGDAQQLIAQERKRLIPLIKATEFKLN